MCVWVCVCVCVSVKCDRQSAAPLRSGLYQTWRVEPREVDPSTRRFTHSGSSRDRRRSASIALVCWNCVSTQLLLSLGECLVWSVWSALDCFGLDTERWAEQRGRPKGALNYLFTNAKPPRCSCFLSFYKLYFIFIYRIYIYLFIYRRYIYFISIIYLISLYKIYI